MKLKNITFNLENCDAITVEGKYIGNFLVDDIRTRFQRTACNSIDKINTAHTIAIEIHKDANKERYAFDQTHIERFKETVFGRLVQWHDITNIEFTLESDWYCEEQSSEKYSYYVNWTGDSETSNGAQVGYISSCGHLYIVITKDKNIEDFFDFEEINDEKLVDFGFKMCDVGDKYNQEEY